VGFGKDITLYLIHMTKLFFYVTLNIVFLFLN